MKRKYLEIRNTAVKDVRCLILNNISQFRKAYRYVIELAMVARDEGLLALESNIGLNAIAQFTADVYGDKIKTAQGLGTGSLFTDNNKPYTEIRENKLYFVP